MRTIPCRHKEKINFLKTHVLRKGELLEIHGKGVYTLGMMKQAKEERRRGMRHVKGKTLRYSSERSGRHIRHPRNGGGLRKIGYGY